MERALSNHHVVNGTRLRALSVVDVFTREALSIEVGRQLRAHDVVAVCNRLVVQRGSPARIFVDNGSEFSSRLLDLWAYHHKTQIDFSRPGKPTDNCFVETFNGSLRDECLNVHWFETIDEAKVKIEAWRMGLSDFLCVEPYTARQGEEIVWRRTTQRGFPRSCWISC